VGCAAVKFSAKIDRVQKMRLWHDGAMESVIDAKPADLHAALKRLD
jgi:hypothetical protein